MGVLVICVLVAIVFCIVCAVFLILFLLCIIKLLRSLAGYTLHDHKTNDSVRRELQTECILDKIDEYRQNWLLHLQRMPPNRIPLKSYHYKPKGKRTIGRPKKRWREQLQLWRRNRSKGPILDVYEDDDDDDDDKFRLQCVFQYDFILMTHSILNLRMLNWFFRFHS